jgi:FkbM family methyltransferase
MSQKKIDNWAMPYIKSFRTYIDIGASTGKTSVPYINKFKTIYAFEPNPESYKTLSENILIKSFNVGLGDVDSVATLIVPDGTKNNEHGSVAELRNKDWTGKSYTVDIKTLDSFLFEDVDFIKIDVEQFEYNVIQGSINTINKYLPVIMFENKRNENDNVISFLLDLGYKINKHKSDTIAYYE